MKTLSKAATAAIVFFGFLIDSAHAHTQLSSSIPADQAVVETAPTEISLSFSEAVRLTAVSVDSGNTSHALEPGSPEPAKDFVVALSELAPGEYVIQWRALSEDTHVMTGEIRFTVSS